MVECEQNMAEVDRPWRGGGLKYDAGIWVKPKDEDQLIRSLMNRKNNNDKRLEDKRIEAKKKRVN